jgi:hypothetical protein
VNVLNVELRLLQGFVLMALFVSATEKSEKNYLLQGKNALFIKFLRYIFAASDIAAPYCLLISTFFLSPCKYFFLKEFK